MRIMPIVAGALIAAGLFLIVRPPVYTSDERVLKLGDIEARMQQDHRLPGWVGGMVLGAGVVLLVTGLSKRS